ncbi:hypothetical protein [Peribacillus alkalitolerans]|uniref:hypothetical protein n=1 Tax=Peribacillus alkalitolerans TaxID=1550385 RepID=UPI0013D4AB7D|nr:hypothetical protein [Peribacillus alkalitolerans]
MELQQVEDIMDFMNQSHLFSRFKNHFYISGIFDTVTDEDMLISFLDHYQFNDESILFDHFRYQFRCFQVIYPKMDK